MDILRPQPNHKTERQLNETQSGAFGSRAVGAGHVLRVHARQQRERDEVGTFEDDRRGTNPEEILGAAHAACFTMAFSFACVKAGLATTDVDTKASVRLSKQGEGFIIDRIALTLQATVPGIDEAKFQAIAAAVKRDCPLSKALASVPEITLQATLRQEIRR